MLKFDFSVLTKDGQRVDSVLIAATNMENAERKLRQMYRYCEILHCFPRDEDNSNKAGQSISVEDILTLISK